MYRIPWLKYQADAPGFGDEKILQVSYLPGKTNSVSIQYRYRKGRMNAGFAGQMVTDPLEIREHRQVRVQANLALNRDVTVKLRADLIFFRKKGEQEEGYFMGTDLLYKPFGRPIDLVARAAFFETGGYDSRIYAFENNVQYVFSVPALYGKGFRYYLTARYQFNRSLSSWIRWAQTLYQDLSVQGSGWDEINSQKRSEWTIQLRWLFPG
jgi:hypothetical protein